MNVRRTRGPSSALVVLAAVLVAAGVSFIVVAARGPAPPATMSERVRAIASTLRCPVCQDLSVADSPSGLATSIRAQIAQKLRAAETPSQIRQGYVGAYGQWILLSPPRRGIDLVAWMIPILLLVAGIGVALAAVWRWTTGRLSGGTAGRLSRGLGDGDAAHPPADTISAEDRRLLERALATIPEESD